MVRIFTTIAVLFCTTSFAQTSVIQLKEVLIRYNSATQPLKSCENRICVETFKNANGDTLASVFSEGVIYMRATFSIKDTLSRITIIEPNGTISNTWHILTGISVIAFNPQNYRVEQTNSGFPLLIYRTNVQPNILASVVYPFYNYWPNGMPPAQTVSGTQIRRFTLP